jgi:hypothetical protein
VEAAVGCMRVGAAFTCRPGACGASVPRRAFLVDNPLVL